MSKIHPNALVDPQAQIADDVEIGPFCVVGPNVKIGSGCKLMAHCYIDGHTTLGRQNTIYPFAALGCNAQDLSFRGGETFLRIGDNNTFREGVTVHTGTKAGTETVIGNGCYLMHNAHVAHNCILHNNVIMVNCAGVTGYVEVGDNVFMSAYSGIHQFCRIGRFAILSAGSVFSQDLPPFMIVEGRNGPVRGVNIIGLKRGGFPPETIRVLRDLYKIFFTTGLNSSNAIAKIQAELPQIPEVLEFIQFFHDSMKAKRGMHQGRTPGRRS